MRGDATGVGEGGSKLKARVPFGRIGPGRGPPRVARCQGVGARERVREKWKTTSFD